MTNLTEMLKKIRDKKAVLGVVGIGYIGLPTSTIFASEGYNVIGFDIDESKVDRLNSGETYIDEPGLAEILHDALSEGRLRASSDFSEINQCDVLMFCIQTPLSPDGKSDMSMLLSGVDLTIDNARDGVLAICESTVPPGTTQTIADKFQSTGHLTLDKNLWCAHCPERVLPGKLIKEFRENVRVIGGLTDDSVTLTSELYSVIVPRSKIVETQAMVSELAKLTENTFRAVNIALANELAKVADTLGIDISEVIRIANLHPRVNVHNPGVGVGGHCIPKDPILLSNTSIDKGFTPELIIAAQALNEDMPKYAVEKLEAAVTPKSTKDIRVLVLGTTFKENVGDTRSAPSERVIELLLKKGAKVQAHDSHTDERFGAENADDLHEALKWADGVFLAVTHDEYRSILPEIDMSDTIFFDGRNSFAPDQLKVALYVAIGRPTSMKDPA